MSEDPQKNSIDDFGKRFSQLADEAAQFGVATCVVLNTDDPISGKSHLKEILRGPRMQSIGMLQQALWHLMAKG